MKWADYYDRFWDWAESTQVRRISTLTDFTSSDQVTEIANELPDEESASALIDCAMEDGMRFTPAQIIDFGYSVTEETLLRAIRSREGKFNDEEFWELECLYDEENLLMEVAKADGIKRLMDGTFVDPQDVDGRTADEVIEALDQIYSMEEASGLVERVINNGMRFTPKQITQIGDYVEEETLHQAIRRRQGKFSEKEFWELEDICWDEHLLEDVARADGVKRFSDGRFTDPLGVEGKTAEDVAEAIDQIIGLEECSDLVCRAIKKGIRFTPRQIIEMSCSVSDKALHQMVRHRQGKFSEEEFEELECLLFDDRLLMEVGRADGIKHYMEQPSGRFTQAVGTLGLMSMLLGDRGEGNNGHPGHCIGDCAHCPAHYGYRYGRWYYGHHHTHGCEFGGNDGSGRA